MKKMNQSQNDYVKLYVNYVFGAEMCAGMDFEVGEDMWLIIKESH